MTRAPTGNGKRASIFLTDPHAPDVGENSHTNAASSALRLTAALAAFTLVRACAISFLFLARCSRVTLAEYEGKYRSMEKKINKKCTSAKKGTHAGGLRRAEESDGGKIGATNNFLFIYLIIFFY